MWQSKPHFEESFTRYADLALDSAAEGRSESSARYSNRYDNREAQNEYPSSEGWSSDRSSGGEKTPSSQEALFRFDPNTIDLNGLVRLGFSAKQAGGILNYRAAGAVFRSASDFGRCYTVSDEKLKQLLPYIDIDADRLTKRINKVGGDVQSNGSYSDVANSTTTTSPELAQSSNSGQLNGLSEASADRFEQMNSTTEVVAVNSNQRSTKYFAPTPVDLNSADSATLVSVRGIGTITAQRIIEYRNRIGGFARVEQLQEIQGMNERNYLSILEQIFVDSSVITKIDINFALPEQLKDHPYLPSRIVNKLLKQRQLKGGWRDTGDLIEQHILSREEAEKLAPYLYFRPFKARK